jgi:hypothetical protein
MEAGEGDGGSCGGLGARERDLKDCEETVHHSGSSCSLLAARDRDHEVCTSVVEYRARGGDEARGETLLRLSWEADSNWSLRLLVVLLRCARLRMLMAWCSTLGGAHSQLGESLAEHAARAGVLSLRQLALATDMEDPLLAAKCKIFAAYSLLQRGKLKSASKIIKQQYHYATGEAVTRDEKLVCMCRAAWARLRTLQHRRGPEPLVIEEIG